MIKLIKENSPTVHCFYLTADKNRLSKNAPL